MIFNLIPANQTHNEILVFDDSEQAWAAWKLLDKMKTDSLVCAHICCYGQYENALEFYSNWVYQWKPYL
jgi:hypothetical protein